MCLSRIIHYQHVSTAAATIIKVTNKNTRDPNSLYDDELQVLRKSNFYRTGSF
jgi:hypothetical protein